MPPPARVLSAPAASAARVVQRYARRPAAWMANEFSQQFIPKNRRVAFGLSLVVLVIAVASVEWPAWWISPGVMILPILGGGLLLWPRALRILFGVAAAGLVYDEVYGKAGVGIIGAIVITAVYADVLANTRGKLGTRGRRADRMMIELRDRIRLQGTLPELGEGWGSTVILRPAGGSSFGGDFVVSHSDGKNLEVALVDVSGKGMDAATRALLLSGAFGGVLGSVPRDQFLPACNAYLRRSQVDEGFVTAVHLSVDLATGEHVLSSAGPPPPVPLPPTPGPAPAHPGAPPPDRRRPSPCGASPRARPPRRAASRQGRLRRAGHRGSPPGPSPCWRSARRSSSPRHGCWSCTSAARTPCRPHGTV